MLPKRRRALFRAVAVAVSIAGALFILEVAVRVGKPQRTAFTGLGLYQFDPDMGHRLRPNIPGSTNSLGLRDRPVAIEKPAGTYRMLAVGDSFTFGSVPLEDVWTEILERRFAGSSPPVEVVNGGVASYNTWQEIDWFEKFGLPLSPDCVILGFFVGGDILENGENQWFDVVDGELVNPGLRPSPLTRLLLKSHLFRLLRGAVSRPVRAAAASNITEEFFYATESGRARVCLTNPPAEVVKAYEITERLLGEFTASLRASGIALVVLLMPDEIQVSHELFLRVTTRFSLDSDAYDLDLPQRRLRAFLAGLGVPTIDVLDALRARQATEPVYIPLDTHWNAIGNAIAAEALHAHFSAAGPLVPK
jgi:hypothetical protein